MIIFDPAMCCSTGVCGPGIDPELLRVATVISNLQRKGIKIERYNLTGSPSMFIENKAINELLNNDGLDQLPVTMIDNKVVKTKSYPTNEEFCEMLDISEDYIKTATKIELNG